MNRLFIAGATLFLGSACDHAGPEAGWASQIVPDSLEARRVEVALAPGNLPWIAPSPDGRYFAGADPETGDLALASLDGEVRRLTDGSGFTEWAPVFSESGDWIAYGWWDMDAMSPDIRIISTSGGEPRVIHHDPEYAVPMDWSPDGRFLSIVDIQDDRTIQIKLLSVETGEPLLVRSLDWSRPQAVSFSPDGRFLAYEARVSDDSHQRDLFVYDLSTGRERTILPHPADDLLLGWSPEGFIYFMSERSGVPAAWRVAMTDGSATGTARIVKPDFWRAGAIGFTRDGAFNYVVRTGGATAYSVPVGPEGRTRGAPRILTAPGEVQGPGSFGLSSDGELLVVFPSRTMGSWADNSRGGAVARVRPVEGGESRDIPLPAGFGRAENPQWMTDGVNLLFVGVDEGRYGLFSLDTRSGTVKPFLMEPLGRSPGLFAYELSPDGAELAYRTGDGDVNGTGSIVIRNLSTGGEKTLFTESCRRAQARSLSISPDGGWIAFYRQCEGSSETGYPLMIKSLADGDSRELGRAGGGPIEWAPDGSALLIGGPEIMRVPVNGGASEALGLEGRVLGFDSAGRHMFIAESNMESPYEVWRIEAGANQPRKLP